MKQITKHLTHLYDGIQQFNHPVTQHLMRNLITIFLLTLTFLLTSCDMMHQPVRGYFEKWTSEVSIQKFEVDNVETYRDKDGNLCIGSDSEANLSLYLINPYHYNYATTYLSKIPDFKDPLVTITADLEDTTLFHLHYPVEYLKDNEAGGDIGDNIVLQHPVNPTKSTFPLKLVCNSRPPEIDAALMTTTDGTDQTYVIAFYQPSKDDCKSIHRDIVSVTINGTVYPLTIQADGKMVFSNPKFKNDRPTTLTTINRRFNESPDLVEVYFLTGEAVIEGHKTYTIGFTDSAGLQTITVVDASLPRIAPPLVVFGSSETELNINEQNTIRIPEGNGKIKVKIKLPTMDDLDEPLDGEGATTVTYGGTGITPDTCYSNTEIELDKGEYTLTVKASRPGYKDSATRTYRIRVISNHIYVKSDGSDMDNKGTMDSPYQTINKAISEFYSYNLPGEEYTIHIIDGLDGPQSILSTIDDMAAKLTIKGQGSSSGIDGKNTSTALKIYTAVPVEIENLTIKNGSAGEGAGIWAGGGTNVTLASGVTVSGNTATYNGGGIFTGGSLTIKDGCTISGNAAGNGGGIYKTIGGGYLQIDGGLIGSSTNDGTSANTAINGGGIYVDNGTLYLNGGTIGYNQATTSGGGIYCKTASTITAGTLVGNSVTGDSGKGGGMYAANTVYISGSPDFRPSSSSGKSNDIYLVENKYINISGGGTSAVAKITPFKWKRGTQVLSNADEAACGRFGLTEASWTIVNSSSTGKIDAPLYVSQTGNDDNNTGTESKPYKTVKKAAEECWDSSKEYTINIVGEVKGAQEIPATTTASGIKLLGTSDAKLNAEGSSTRKKRALTINPSIPVTISSITITGGCDTYGAGLYINSNGYVCLGSNTIINGNKAVKNDNSGGQGGGIYVCSGAKLFVYGNALIGDSTSSTADSSHFGNSAESLGGGIYNQGTVYLGNSDPDAKQTLAGGVKRNYAGLNGGGIYNANGGTVIMNSGNISYNAGVYGGGVYGTGSSSSSKSTFELNGGTFTSNGAASNGGAVYLSYYGVFKLQGAPSIQCSVATENDVYLASSSGNIASISMTGNVTGGLLKLSLASGNWVMSRVLKPESGTTLPTFGDYIQTIDTSYKINSNGYLLSTSKIKSISTKEELELACQILSSGDELTLKVTAKITPTSNLNIASGAKLTLNRSTDPNDDVNSGTMSYMLNFTSPVTIGSATSGTLILDGGKNSSHSCYAPLVGTWTTVTMYNVVMRNNDSTKTPPEGIGNPGNAGEGGAIRMNGGTDLTLDNCTITNCKAKNGGGICGYGSLQVNSNCTLSTCTATNNGGFLDLAATISSSSGAYMDVDPTYCTAANGNIAYLHTEYSGYVAQIDLPNRVDTAIYGITDSIAIDTDP